jgi:tetratricopeptide (TPR) repeat protein
MLAVGPGTPASLLWISRDRCAEYIDENDRPHSSHNLPFFAESYDNENDDDDEEDDVDDYDDEDDDGDDDEENRTAFEQEMSSYLRAAAAQATQQQPPRSEHRNQTYEGWLPSIHHVGCVNTACWLNVPWRLATASIDSATSASSGQKYVPKSNASSTYEIPTQLVTSGDDCMIKVWDLKNSMGSVSPLDGGWDTFSPLTLSSNKDVGSDDTYKSWVKSYDDRNEDSKIAGSVKLLAKMHSGHRANVFHVQPLLHKPGKFLSCGADGFLRLSDLESSTSAEVVNPGMEAMEGFTIPMVSMERFTDRMAYSFQLLSQNTGLLCTDRGLRYFDIRLRPSEQRHASIYKPSPSSSSSSEGTFQSYCCKTCAVWKPHQYREYGSYPMYSDDEMESTYVFTGGSGESVELLDLRMLGGSSSNSVLERYCPDVFKGGKPSVSVSGIDVTRDGRELLVSYENDQIYTFKIFGGSSCSAGPSSEEIDESSKLFESDSSRSINYHAMYGGHVNCVTFLKQTAYAGPNDEYILTGGDAGKAWIYERSTGAVAAMLNADRNACNGIVPHPTLPYFVTYGIDKTAKLWRAPSTRDSPLARAEASLQRKEYEPGPLSRQWNKIIHELSTRKNEIPNVFPDVVLTLDKSEEDMDLCGHAIPDITDGYAAFSTYGNSLRCLEFELSDTKSRYYHSKMCDSSSNFLAQGLQVHTLGITWRRLQSQATRLGMRINITVPWVFEKFVSTQNQISGFHPVDLLPDYPSDWIQYHPLMQNVPFPEAYSSLIELHKAFPGHDELDFNIASKKISLSLPWLSDDLQATYMNMETSGWDSDISYSENNVLAEDVSVEEQQDNNGQGEVTSTATTKPIAMLTPFQVRSRRILEDTIDALKNGGNEAMKLGLCFKAAQRYDKAVSYCAVALMPHVDSDKILSPFTIAHLTFGDEYDSPPGTTCKLWSPIVRNLLAIRLNLSLLMLKPELNNPSYAADLAEMVLVQLSPYTVEKGIVFFNVMVSKNEPIGTYLEAKTVESKAHFRLGCARYELKDYSKAVKHFQASLDCFQEIQKISMVVNPETPQRKPDAALLRRLQDAKLQMKKKKDRTNKKFLSAIGSTS